MRHVSSTLLLSALLSVVCVPRAQSVSPNGSPGTQPEREAIVGAWRLVSITYTGPNGALADPVFGPRSEGLIIYDPSGWMSVQIYSVDRPAMARPPTRTLGSVSPEAAKAKAAAFDTYYAYFGTWDYDASTSIITHHLKSSLLPYETGVDYRRSASINGGRLELTVSNQVDGETRRRTLVWERPPSETK